MAIDSEIMEIDIDKKPLFRYLNMNVTPLVEIFEVTIHHKDDELLENNYEIYGQIKVSDKLDQSFYMFNRDKDHPQRIGFDEPLLLTPPQEEMNAVIIPSQYVSMHVLLYDRVRGDIIVAKGSFSLDRNSRDQEWLEECYKREVGGVNNLYAKVQYAIFPYAVTANVDILFFAKDDDFDSLKDIDTSGVYFLDSTQDYPCETSDEYDVTDYTKNKCNTLANIHGTVSATTGFNGTYSKFTHPWRLLFSNTNEDPLEITSGDFIDLSRSLVVVPAFSSLIVQATFSYRDSPSPAVSGFLEFKPNDLWISKQDIVGDNGRIRVRVVWSCAFRQLYRVTSEKRLGPLTPNIEESRSSDPFKKLKPLGEHQSSGAVSDDWSVFLTEHPTADLRGNCILPPPSPTFNSMVELFSIVICRKDRLPFKFYGSVRVSAGIEFPVLSIDQSCPQECPGPGMCIIPKGVDRHASALRDYCVFVDLMDVSGEVLSKGLAHVIEHDMHRYPNRRWCTVVRGVVGFAAVHYSTIPDAVVAAVEVKLCGKSLPGVVKGEIYAYNGNWDPPRSYQEQLFRSVLFYDTHDGILLDDSGSNLKLQKTVVSLPRCSYLVIKADLSLDSVYGGSATSANLLKGSAIFTANEDFPSRIGGEDLYLEVSVEFSIAN